MSRWPIRIRSCPPARITLQKVQSGQCPGVVAAGWKEERTNNYWSTGDRLYEKRGEDFIHIETKSLAEFVKGIRK
jgi:hypothetical protein